jgi:hypothetical protein
LTWLLFFYTTEVMIQCSFKYFDFCLYFCEYTGCVHSISWCLLFLIHYRHIFRTFLFYTDSLPRVCRNVGRSFLFIYIRIYTLWVQKRRHKTFCYIFNKTFRICMIVCMLSVHWICYKMVYYNVISNFFSKCTLLLKFDMCFWRKTPMSSLITHY